MFRTGYLSDPMAASHYHKGRLPTTSWLPQAPRLPTRDVAVPRSLPDPLRCGYTSKRCENPRTVKKSGGLHRFCAYHRERANKNQWRVDNRRRLLRRKGTATTPTNGAVSGSSPRSTTSEHDETELGEPCEESADITTTSEGELLDPAGSPDTLSEQDAKILNAMLFSDEDEPAKSETTKPFEPSAVVGHPVQVERASAMMPALVSSSSGTPCGVTVSTDARWNCVCSQCLAWPAVLFSREAIAAARKSRVEPYARV